MSTYSSGRKIGPLCGTVGRINLKQMGPVHCPGRFQDTVQFDSPSVYSSDKSESTFLPVITRRNNGTSPETGSGKGTRSGNSWFLFPTISCSQKEQKVTSCNRSFSVESVYKELTIQNGDKSVLVDDWSVTIDLTDAYLTDSSLVKEVS